MRTRSMVRSVVAGALLGATFLVAIPSGSPALAVPAGFTDSLVGSFTTPTAVKVLPGGDLLVLEKGGTFQRVAANGSVWFPLEDRGQVARVDATSGEIQALIEVGDPSAIPDLMSDPHAVAAGATGIWVARAADHSVGRIDPATNAVAESIPLSVVPRQSARAIKGFLVTRLPHYGHDCHLDQD